MGENSETDKRKKGIIALYRHVKMVCAKCECVCVFVGIHGTEKEVGCKIGMCWLRVGACCCWYGYTMLVVIAVDVIF